MSKFVPFFVLYLAIFYNAIPAKISAGLEGVEESNEKLHLELKDMIQALQLKGKQIGQLTGILDSLNEKKDKVKKTLISP